jgi:ribosomal protein S8E
VSSGALNYGTDNALATGAVVVGTATTSGVFNIGTYSDSVGRFTLTSGSIAMVANSPSQAQLTSTGTILLGTIIERNEKNVRLRTSASDSIEIAQADITSIVSAPSAMPEIAALVMTKTEIRDLVAAVASLRTPPRRNELTQPRALLAPPID